MIRHALDRNGDSYAYDDQADALWSRIEGQPQPLHSIISGIRMSLERPDSQVTE